MGLTGREENTLLLYSDLAVRDFERIKSTSENVSFFQKSQVWQRIESELKASSYL